MVWKQNDSHSAFALLHGCQEQHSFPLLIQSECFQIFEINSFSVHCICQWGGISGLRHVADELHRIKTKLAPDKVLP